MAAIMRGHQITVQICTRANLDSNSCCATCLLVVQYTTSMDELVEKKLTRFELRLERAKNPRCRKYNRRLPPPPPAPPAPRTNLQAVLEDLRSGDLAGVHEDPYVCGGSAQAKRVLSGVESGVKAAVFVAGAMVADAVESVKGAIEARKEKKRQQSEAELRARNLAIRRKYYEKDAERRRDEAERIREATLLPKNPMPTPEALIHAYVHRHISEEAAMRFGNLVADLDEHVRWKLTKRNSEGRIVEGSGGVREWLKKNCPELAPHYHTCQRFKRKAQPDPK